MAGYIGSKAVNLSTTGADINGDANIDGDLSFRDNDKAIFGAGSDLQIYHNGINSFIADSGTGGITLRSDIFTVQNAAGNETVAQFVQDGFVKLFHNNSQVFTTTSTGASITGSLGIGISSPVYPLVVQAANPRLQLLGTGTNAGISGLLFGDADTATRGQINYNHSSDSLDVVVNGSERMRIDSSGNVGIGTSSIASDATVHIDGTDTILLITEDSEGDATLRLADTQGNLSQSMSLSYDTGSTNSLKFIANGTSERMRIDASGNLLVGKTSLTFNTEGHALAPTYARFTRDGDAPVQFNRTTSDGEIALFYKNGSTVGRIGNNSTRIFIGSGDTNLTFNSTASKYIFPSTADGGGNDNVIDLGISTARFDDIHATNGTIQTSDRNEKQDIEALSDAEQRVAVAAKGLMRKFRWKNRVAEKGDEARTHFGIIAQDLQAAFAAEGLDAGDYAMFISTTWWETQTEVPAIEAVAEVLDEDGNVVTEAVEAADAYTRTDTYDTQEEAPEGATERTRLGVRYSELLAFIIGAL